MVRYGSLKRKRVMKANRLYRVENIEAGAFGFGEGRIGLLFFPGKHPKNNHGLTEFDRGYYVKKYNGEIWKLNGKFKNVSLVEKLNFYFEKFKYRLIEIKKIIFKNDK